MYGGGNSQGTLKASKEGRGRLRAVGLQQLGHDAGRH